MNETKTSDRLAELTMLELLDEMNSRLSSVQVITETTRILTEQSTTLGEKVMLVKFMTEQVEPMLAEVQKFMDEYNKRLTA